MVSPMKGQSRVRACKKEPALLGRTTQETTFHSAKLTKIFAQRELRLVYGKIWMPAVSHIRKEQK